MIEPQVTDAKDAGCPSQMQGGVALAIAAVMLLAWAFPSFWPRALHRSLQDFFVLELLALASFFVLLLVVGGMPKFPRLSDKVLYWGIGLGYLAFLGLLAVSSAGPMKALEGGLLLYVTYGSMLWRRPARRVLVVYLFRWIFSFLLLWLLMMLIVGAYQAIWGRDRHVDLLVAAAFFGTLGTLDIANAFSKFVEWRGRQNAEPV